MSDPKAVLQPNDRFPWTIQGAAKEIMVEILSGKKLSDKKVKLHIRALEDAKTSDGNVIVSVGFTSEVEIDLPEGFDFNPTPRSETRPYASLGDEQEI